MKFSTALVLIAAWCAASAFADEKLRNNHNKTAEEMFALQPGKVSPKLTFYAETILPYGDWQTANPNQAAALTLFEGYKLPPLTQKIDGQLLLDKAGQPQVEDLIYYVAQTKAVMNVPAEKIKVSGLLTNEAIQALDPKSKVQEISAADSMPSLIASKHQNKAFADCTFLKKPAVEGNALQFEAHPFCEPKSNRKCFELCYKADVGFMENAALSIKQFFTKRAPDTGLGANLEVNTYETEAEYGSSIPLAKLTGLDAPVVGIIEVRFFYVNQLIRSAKLVSVLQKVDDSKTMISTYFSIGVKAADQAFYSSSYNISIIKYLQEGTGRDLDKGSIMGGIPNYVKLITNRLINMNESGAATN